MNKTKLMYIQIINSFYLQQEINDITYGQVIYTVRCPQDTSVWRHYLMTSWIDFSCVWAQKWFGNINFEHEYTHNDQPSNTYN